MKIVSADRLYITKEDRARLEKAVDFNYYEDRPKDDDNLLARIEGADVVLTWGSISDTALAAFSGVKMICMAVVGYHNFINVELATKKGIKVTYCPGHNAPAVAEANINLMLMAARHVVPAIEDLKAGKFNADYQKYRGKELLGKTLGVVGYGTIGKKIGAIAKAFGMTIIGISSSSTRVELEDLLTKSDFISCSLPINETTKGFIGAKEFELMKDGVVLVNTGRGATVDETALIANLRSGKVYAAGLDVMKEEDPFDTKSELFKLPNVVITPHIAFDSIETDVRLSNQVTNIALAYANGELLFPVPEQQKL